MNTTVGDVVRDVRPLSWSRTVAREMVHRDSVAEVLLTDVRRSPDGGFDAAASWSRSHPTFPRDGADLHSPLMIVETLRQLGIYIPLRYFEVAPTAHLLITDLFFEIDPSAEPRAVSGATGVICRVRVSEVRRAAEDGTLTGVRLDVSFTAHGAVFAQAGGGARVMDGERYGALRTGRARAAAPAGALGRIRPDSRGLGVTGAHDVVLGLDGGTLLVDPADPRHPFFFDHATDHVPGIILLEAARQAAAVESRGALLRPTGGRFTAARFVEYSPSARIICVPYHNLCVFRFLQDGEQRAFGVLRYR
ncbi:ScbA/BarX family gamma-butyrolactone biosynthesis protein [Streptomyces sp. NPDC002018]|uniref:ScbA/BarX family gamma-butyrolactone biosynthesis protein n=1 Tax=Streptomyces sp. NPDC002018 TaxID=3364629 RepID=UPI0036B14FBA